MRRLPIALVVLVWAVGAGAASPPGGEKGLVLDENGYFRIYYEFGLMRISAAAIKAEGEKLLGDSGLQRLAKRTRGHLRDRSIDWKKTDWRDLAVVHFCRTQLGDDTRAVEMIQTVPPPAGWSGAGFDDSTWMRQRIGSLPTTRYMMESYDFSWHMIRAIHLRSHFQVDDPARAGDLTLNLGYRGGARVLVNGQEVARGHLPAGELRGAPGEDYPGSAYLTLPEETPPRYSGNMGDIRCPYDSAPRSSREGWGDFRMTASRQPLNRNGWERLTKLRDRRLDGIKIPAKLLRKGRNVLAVEIRRSHFHPRILPGAGDPRADNWTRGGGTENHTWAHARLLSVELRGGSSGVAPCTERPGGVQAWAEDMHTRLFDRDFNPTGWPEGKVRLVAALNGSFSAQVGVGTDRQLNGLEVSVSPLKGALSEGSGRAPGSIPPSAVSVSYLKGHPITRLYELGHDRCLGTYHWNCPMAVAAVARYHVALPPPPKGPPPADPVKAREAEARLQQARTAEWAKMLSEFKFFDHITAEAPATIPAGTCQPIWLTVKVPPDATPGMYRGSLAVRAAGVEPVTLPVELEVIDWRIPDPLEFQSIVESEQSPYGVHKAYSPPPPAEGKPAPQPLKLWSQRHWQMIEASFRQLARLGADWIFVPVLMNSEFGNRDDCSMIKWIRRTDGSLDFDYAVLDRYLDVAIKHLGKPRVICVQIMHGVGSATNAVKVHDEATGKVEVVDVGPASVGKRRPLWRAFATSLVAHLRGRGLAEGLYWGHAFDRVYDPGLVKLMAELTPGVPWAAGAHARKPDATFRAVARTYGSDMTDRSMMGWKNPFIHLLMPRSNGSTICVEGTSTPFTYRVMCDRGIYCGFSGVGRMGADYFNGTWFDGFSGGEYLLVGRSCVQTLWPGPEGAETSARNEAMLEGIQEAEARIFIEQALDRELLAPALAAESQKVLDDHFRSTLYIPGGTAALTMMEYTGDWQARSRRLFATAAKVAAAVGVDLDRTQIGAEKLQAVFYGQIQDLAGRKGVPLPAEGKAAVTVKLRNWTGKPRRWQAATTQPWIRPSRTAGSLAGQEDLTITLDGKGMTPGKTVTGRLTITDLSAGAGAVSGGAREVEIVAEVVKPLELIVKQTLFNVTVGESASQDYLLLNRSASPRTWTIGVSAPWMNVSPASGKLAPGESTFVKLTVSPPDKSAAVHETKLTLTASGGAASDAFDFRTFVIPPYSRPQRLPGGTPVPLETVSKALLARHVSTNWFRSDETHREPTFSRSMSLWHTDRPVIIGGKTYPMGLWALPPHETVYDVAGKGFTAFSAEVGWNSMVARDPSAGRGHNTFQLSFEIFIDGRIVTQSGLMDATDKARLLVAAIPPGARRIRLVTRATANFDLARGIGYANWVEPKLYTK